MEKTIKLYLIPFLHQTTTSTNVNFPASRCILFHFYIKPQPHTMIKALCVVVSYSISTSNHNSSSEASSLRLLYLIPFLHQTTTCGKCEVCLNKLYLIPFLHQTTTSNIWVSQNYLLYLIPFLHQTTTSWTYGCSYVLLYLIPFLHQTTTLHSQMYL